MLSALSSIPSSASIYGKTIPLVSFISINFV